jgi:hypothetical protein
MSGLTNNLNVMSFTSLATSQSVTMDLTDCDLFSAGINVAAATGSNTLTLQESTDGTNFVIVATLVITAPGTTIWHVDPVFSQFLKILYTPGSGAATFTVSLNCHCHTIETAGLGTRNISRGTS